LKGFAANEGHVDPDDIRWALRQSDVVEWLKRNNANPQSPQATFLND
jgi:hypothetical protein